MAANSTPASDAYRAAAAPTDLAPGAANTTLRLTAKFTDELSTRATSSGSSSPPISRCSTTSAVVSSPKAAKDEAKNVSSGA